MKPIEPLPPVRSRLIGTDAARPAAGAPAAPACAAAAQAQPGVIAQSPSAGIAAPMDSERVAQIRDALREGTYPLTPAKVADAMIAANFILIEGETN